MSIDWKTLTEHLDYHHKKWYEGIGCAWTNISKQRVREILAELEPDEDEERIIRQFINRDGEAHARSKDSKREAQLSLGDWI